MNIMLFLTHKSDITYLYDDYTLEEGLEIVRKTSYTAVPLISREGKYIGTVTEGDFLWALCDPETWNARKTIRMNSVVRHVQNKRVRADAQIYDLLDMALNQNFVPVTDDRDCFVGIVTRKRVLDYCLSEMRELSDAASKV